MDISITTAGAQLDDLVRRAQAGETIILTHDGLPAVRLEPLPVAPPKVDREARAAAMRDIARAGAANAVPGPCAARSQDFLYDEYGLPA